LRKHLNEESKEIGMRNTIVIIILAAACMLTLVRCNNFREVNEPRWVINGLQDVDTAKTGPITTADREREGYDGVLLYHEYGDTYGTQMKKYLPYGAKVMLLEESKGDIKLGSHGYTTRWCKVRYNELTGYVSCYALTDGSLGKKGTTLYVTERSGLKLRGDKNISSAVIALMPYRDGATLIEESGEPVRLMGASGKWCRVEWDGKTGWAFSGFLSPHAPKADPEDAFVGEWNVVSETYPGGNYTLLRNGTFTAKKEGEAYITGTWKYVPTESGASMDMTWHPGEKSTGIPSGVSRLEIKPNADNSEGFTLSGGHYSWMIFKKR